MSLKELNLKYKYRSDHDQIYSDFYRKCLGEAHFYDRAVGYFTSDSLRIIAKGLDRFIDQEGKIRIIANPHLTKEDIEAIRFGYKAKHDVIAESLLRAFSFNEDAIIDDSLNTLAWLIYKEKLEIKIAFTKNNSLYHEKFGIFYDRAGNKVAFSGSANETIGGIKNNFEKIDVFWKESDQERIEDMVVDFENLWANNTNGLTVMDIPNILKDKIVSYKREGRRISHPVNVIKPRPYQQEAIEAVKSNNWKGILEMATGTGKTITSLLISNEFYKENNRIFLVIIVPFTHLVEQWEKNCQALGYQNFTNCFGNKKSWVNKLQTDIRDYNLGIIMKHVAITTYKTAASLEFNQLISKLRGKGFLIADECHYFGVRSLRENKLHELDGKIGLSATPKRWWDEDGSSYIEEFFGEPVYQYDMKEAIVNGALTEYIYNPIIVDLTDDELERYERLTRRLIHLYSSEEAKKDEIRDVNRQRSLILSKAENKKDLLYSIFDAKVREEVSHTLVYCAPGEVDVITKELADLGYRVHRFDSKVSLIDRMKILDAFEIGSIQILVAIKCLDEGVDVPSTKSAYFLASTSNPREFVQRRGRILRKSPNKSLAMIYDFITLPTQANDQMYKSIASKELPRFAEFSRFAINNFNAREVVGKELKRYSLDYLMDKLPWDVYNEFHKQLGVLE
jgi:superfamily II DNA or RNA helicase